MGDPKDLHNIVKQHLYGNPVKHIFNELSSLKPLVDQAYNTLWGNDPKPFETLIRDLMTPSSEQHTHAKSLFNLYKRDYQNILVRKLIERAELGDLRVRATSAILVRSLFNETWYRNSLAKVTLSRVKSGLLNWVVNEESKQVTKILGNAISMVASDDTSSSWPEFMPSMFDRLESEECWSQESTLIIFARLAEDVLLPHLTRLHAILMTHLHNVTSVNVRIAAFFASIHCILCIKSPSDRDRFKDLLPAMMHCLEIMVLSDGHEVGLSDGHEVVLSDGDEDLNEATVLNEAMAQEASNDGDEALNLLIQLAKTEPRFLKGHFVVVVEGMLRIAEAESLQERTRHLAIEFVITLVEARDPAPRMMSDLPQFIISRFSAFFMRRKFRELISRLFAIFMRLLLADIEYDAEWNSAKNQDEDESSNYRVGKDCLHRLAIALGGKIAYKQLCKYLAKPDDKWQYHAAPDHSWQKHLATLIALAQIVGHSKVMIPNLDKLVTMVLSSFEDPAHPRVRWAAINAIGALSNCVGPSLLNQYHDRVLPALYLALDDVDRRVQAHAVSVVLNFSPQCPNLDKILNKLIKLTLLDPNIRVLKLANSLEESNDVQIRANSVIQLGELLEEPLGVLTVYLVQLKLLRCVEKELNRIVMKNLGHTIATFFNVLCIENGWPELFSYVERWASGDSDRLKEAALFILGPMKLVLSKGLNEGGEVTTRDGIGRFFLNLRGLKKLCSWFCIIFRKKTVTTQEASIEYFSWRQLVGFVNSAIEIAQSDSLEKETRHLAVDFVISLGEGTLGNGRHIGYDKLFRVLMVEIETEVASHWVENEELRNFNVVMKFLDRLIFLLDKNSVAWHVLKRYLGATEWQKRVAAIVAIPPIFNGFKVRLAANNATGQLSIDLDPNLHQEYLPALAEAIYTDLDPRVRGAAIDATLKLSIDLEPDLLPFYHVFVLPALGEATCDFEYPEVQEHAAFTMINMSNNHQLDALPFLRETVCILLETHKSSRLERLELHGREDLDEEDMDWNRARIGESEILLILLIRDLPNDTWDSIRASLTPSQEAEYHLIRDHM
ncbi:importin-5 [Artemisia annua]|uniref:Importin-5 n=1 Tax=Artemisia annua TaxID=35608 RepID=A0A2U1QBA8_ARTAN|nr:importin-5 [Artemisia annua]